MRVLMILMRDIHYAARVQREAVALAEAGWEVDIACLHTTLQPPPELHERIRLLRFPISTRRIKSYVERKADQRLKQGVYRVVRTPVVKMAKDVVAQRQFAQKVWELCEQASYDAVHCYDLNTLSIGVYLKRKKGISLIYDCQELYREKYGKGRLEKMVGYQAESWWINHVDCLITTNELMEEEFRKRNDSLRSVVIRNVPSVLPELPEKKRYFHNRFRLQPEDQIVLYQGVFIRNRGLETLIEAVSHLPENVKLVMIGYGEWKEYLERWALHHCVDGRVFFHPPLLPEDLLFVTCHADIGVVFYTRTSRESDLATPTSTHEYIHAGVPVLTSPQPGKTLPIRQSGAGKSVDPLDPDGVAKALQEMLADPGPFIQGCIKARNTWKWESERQRLIQLYENIYTEQEHEKESNYYSIKPQLRQL
ncbi:hypothetical protein GCM10011571_24300 [Marinithermofilum abyssi]|uniref:Uncharacterized protein n=1 Tax=Marinithermofilum abyssi TaxID=1571185 RepID=A0A8J2YAW2_9BACL|nr:glycosyltransferase [Marinithermofilum abyssi]GGE21349.1 hypothetical protein GCM10011571_24300 [Marinithermofilum abyssi]